jgi:hypothetical protein
LWQVDPLGWCSQELSAAGISPGVVTISTSTSTRALFSQIQSFLIRLQSCCAKQNLCRQSLGNLAWDFVEEGTKSLITALMFAIPDKLHFSSCTYVVGILKDWKTTF